MKLIIAAEVDGTEPEQDAHVDELEEVVDGRELVHIKTSSGEIPVYITAFEEA